METLVGQGLEISVLDDFSNGHLSNLSDAQKIASVKVIKGSVTDAETVKRSLKDVEAVFHEAALVSVQRSVQQPGLTQEINVKGTKCLVDACVQGHVRRLIFASSAAVYGDSPDLPRKETSALHPLSPYGWSKLEGERICLKAFAETGLGATALRYFNIYGPRSTVKQYSGVINAFADALIFGKPPVIYGDGKQTRDLIHVSDIASANILAAASPMTVGKVLNVGTGVQTSVADLVQLEHDLLFGSRAPASVVYGDAREGDVRDSYADISLINELTGFSPKYKLKEGLESYFRWLYPGRTLE